MHDITRVYRYNLGNRQIPFKVRQHANCLTKERVLVVLPPTTHAAKEHFWSAEGPQPEFSPQLWEAFITHRLTDGQAECTLQHDG